jgi:hypothetical protein
MRACLLLATSPTFTGVEMFSPGAAYSERREFRFLSARPCVLLFVDEAAINKIIASTPSVKVCNVHDTYVQLVA